MSNAPQANGRTAVTEERPKPSPRTNYPDIFGMLATPFRPEHIKTRPQSGRQLQYVTARTVMNRLDFALGPENWWDEYEASEHSVECKLSIRLPDGQVLTKCDAGGYAGMTDQGDDDKSGYSDAFKRAAVKFGVGRHLYNDGVVSYPKDRQLPTDAPASRPEPLPAAPAIPVADAPSQPTPSDVRKYVQEAVDSTNNEWAILCGNATPKRDGKPIVNVSHCVNGVIKMWLESEMITEGCIRTDGKQDKAKVAAVLRAAWEDDRQSTQDDIELWLRHKLEDAAREAGINLDAEPAPVEAPSNA